VFAVRRQQTKPVARSVRELVGKHDAQREQGVEVDEGEVLFVAGEATLVQEMKERSPSLANLFPRFLLSEDGVVREILLEIEGAQQHVTRFALPVGPDRQITRLREDYGIHRLADEGHRSIGSPRLGRDDEVRTAEQQIALFEGNTPHNVVLGEIGRRHGSLLFDTEAGGPSADRDDLGGNGLARVGRGTDAAGILKDLRL
jgi:hypothetical protein